jgi:hypothetical protein
VIRTRQATVEADLRAAEHELAASAAALEPLAIAEDLQRARETAELGGVTALQSAVESAQTDLASLLARRSALDTERHAHVTARPGVLRGLLGRGGREAVTAWRAKNLAMVDEVEALGELVAAARARLAFATMQRDEIALPLGDAERAARALELRSAVADRLAEVLDAEIALALARGSLVRAVDDLATVDRGAACRCIPPTFAAERTEVFERCVPVTSTVRQWSDAGGLLALPPLVSRS